MKELRRFKPYLMEEVEEEDHKMVNIYSITSSLLTSIIALINTIVTLSLNLSSARRFSEHERIIHALHARFSAVESSISSFAVDSTFDVAERTDAMQEEQEEQERQQERKDE